MNRRTKLTVSLAFVAMLVTSGAAAQSHPELGAEVVKFDSDPSMVLDGSVVRLEADVSVSRGQTVLRVIIDYHGGSGTAHRATIDGVEFVVAFHSDLRPRVFYVETTDPGFSTPEGARVGLSYKELMAATERSRPRRRVGRCSVCLTSGWEAVFEESRSCRKRRLKKSAVGMLRLTERTCAAPTA